MGARENPRCEKVNLYGEERFSDSDQDLLSSGIASPRKLGKWKFLYASGASPGLKALKAVLKGAQAFPMSPSGAPLVSC